jgi:hypothetical protein
MALRSAGRPDRPSGLIPARSRPGAHLAPDRGDRCDPSRNRLVARLNWAVACFFWDRPIRVDDGLENRTTPDAFFRGHRIIVPEDGVEAFSDEDQATGLVYLRPVYQAEVPTLADLR